MDARTERTSAQLSPVTLNPSSDCPKCGHKQLFIKGNTASCGHCNWEGPLSGPIPIAALAAR